MSRRRPPDAFEQQVTGGVPETVVHRLESIDVDEEHREQAPAPLRVRQRLRQPVTEELSIW
jgi:hypothetical protein